MFKIKNKYCLSYLSDLSDIYETNAQVYIYSDATSCEEKNYIMKKFSAMAGACTHDFVAPSWLRDVL